MLVIYRNRERGLVLPSFGKRRSMGSATNSYVCTLNLPCASRHLPQWDGSYCHKLWIVSQCYNYRIAKAVGSELRWGNL